MVIISSVSVDCSSYKVERPLRWKVHVSSVQRWAAKTLWTRWRLTAVEKTNVTNASKHLTKQNIWMSISSLILVNNPTSVLNATNHVPLQVNFEATWWLTLGRNCTSVNYAASHLLNLELSIGICSHIHRRNLTVVSNATTHSIKLEIWRTTC